MKKSDFSCCSERIVEVLNEFGYEGIVNLQNVETKWWLF